MPQSEQYYVYILKSTIDHAFYKGFSMNAVKRLEQHNNGECKYTSMKKTWELVYMELCVDKTTALKREKSLK